MMQVCIVSKRKNKKKLADFAKQALFKLTCLLHTHSHTHELTIKYTVILSI